MVNVLTAGGAGKVTKPPPKTNNNNRRKKNNNRNDKNNSTENNAAAQVDEEEKKRDEEIPKFAMQTQINAADSGSGSFVNSTNVPYSDNPTAQSDGHTSGTNNTSHSDSLIQGRDPRTSTGGNSSKPITIPSSSNSSPAAVAQTDVIWLTICFFGIMASFVAYGLLLEYTTSGGRKLHELSFLFITSGLYTLTAAAGRYVRDETPTTIPPARFAILGLTSMGSTFCSVRSLRYVIFPIQVLAKSCKPVPVMLMGAVMGKKYPLRKYFNVALIVGGVALFMGGGDQRKKKHAGTESDDDASSSAGQVIGLLLLFISLCFDGGTGAYEDKLMSVHSVQPFDLMYNIQLGKTILAGIGLLVLNQMHIFLQMIQEMGFLLVALGLTGALGQVFIFVTIAKFGALTCSIIGLARKVTTLVASIYYFGHHLNSIQFIGLVISVLSMVMDFFGKKKGGHGHGKPPKPPVPPSDELKRILDEEDDVNDKTGDVELGPRTTR